MSGVAILSDLFEAEAREFTSERQENFRRGVDAIDLVALLGNETCDRASATHKGRLALLNLFQGFSTSSMARRTTLQIDDELLSRAQEALGTSGLKETVDKAFHESIRRHLRERLAARISTGEGIDRSPEILAETRPLR